MGASFPGQDSTVDCFRKTYPDFQAKKFKKKIKNQKPFFFFEPSPKKTLLPLLFSIQYCRYCQVCLWFHTQSIGQPTLRSQDLNICVFPNFTKQANQQSTASTTQFAWLPFKATWIGGSIETLTYHSTVQLEFFRECRLQWIPHSSYGLHQSLSCSSFPCSALSLHCTTARDRKMNRPLKTSRYSLSRLPFSSYAPSLPGSCSGQDSSIYLLTGLTNFQLSVSTTHPQVTLLQLQEQQQCQVLSRLQSC